MVETSMQHYNKMRATYPYLPDPKYVREATVMLEGERVAEIYLTVLFDDEKPKPVHYIKCKCELDDQCGQCMNARYYK